jgi:hypothetical protein
MLLTRSGKAWKFVGKVWGAHKRLQEASTTSYSHIHPGAVDAMVFLAERMFQTQEKLSKANKPVHVDLGYHYTQKKILLASRHTVYSPRRSEVQAVFKATTRPGHWVVHLPQNESSIGWSPRIPQP